MGLSARAQVAASGKRLELCCNEKWRCEDIDNERVIESLLRCSFNTLCIPAIAKSKDSFVIRHEVDFQRTESHPTYNSFVSSLGKSPLAEFV